MKVEFLKTFSKDLDLLKNKTVKSRLLKLIEFVESCNSLEEIPSIKKLKGHRNAYRIRLGDFRLGFFLSNNIIFLARFVDRKDIYKYFP